MLKKCLYDCSRLISGTMSTKKCCYMDRVCTSECVAYIDSGELNGIAGFLGLQDIHCVRLLVELADMMDTIGSMDFEDFEDEDEF